MGLEVMELPEPVHRVPAHALGAGHGATAPVRHALGACLQRGLDDGVTLGLIMHRLAPTAGGNLPNCVNSLSRDSRPPQLDGVPVDL